MTMQQHSYRHDYPSYPRYSEPPVKIPKDHLSWFEKMMFGFGLLTLIIVAYGLWNAGQAGSF
jgi:hypothetical protein